MTQEEMNTARTLWDDLHAQWTKAGARNAYLADNPTDPEWDDLDARATRSDIKFGRLRNELAAWAGVSALRVAVLLAGPGRGEATP